MDELHLYGSTIWLKAGAYDVISGKIEMVTIYPLAQKEIKNKFISGRWIKKESKNGKKKN